MVGGVAKIQRKKGHFRKLAMDVQFTPSRCSAFGTQERERKRKRKKERENKGE